MSMTEPQRTGASRPALLPFAEGEDLTPASPQADPKLAKLWQAIASSAVMPAPDADKLRAIEPLLASVKQKTTLARVLEPPDLAALCSSFAGLFKRLPTGFAALDAHTGGGLQTSRLHIFGGAPGAHKTSLLTRIVYPWARDGVVVNGVHHEVLVVLFATDEPRHGLLSRIGQIEGLVRADLDNEDTTVSGPAWATLGERLRAVPNLMIFDSRFDAVTVEELVEMAAARAHGRRVVFLVDSLHSAPFRSDTEGHDGPRAKIEARMKAAVNLAIKHRVCFIATSELNRGAYRSRAQAEQVADLAAFKESSGIEYGADLGILLRTVPCESNKVVEMAIAKNRLGDSDVTFWLERGAHLTYREVPMPEGGGRRGEDAEEESHHQWKILEAIRTSTEPLRSANDVYRVVKGNKAKLLQGFKALTEQGRIVSVGGRLRVHVTDMTENRSPHGSMVPEPDGTDGTSERKPVPSVLAPFRGQNRMEPRRDEAPDSGDPLAEAKTAILEVLNRHPGAPGWDWVWEQLRPRRLPGLRERGGRAGWAELLLAGRIENRGKANRPSFYVRESNTRAPPDPDTS